MSIKTKLATLAIAALAVTAVSTASYAKPKINPIVPALVGAAVVTGAVVAASQPHYIHRPRHCWLEARQNIFTGQIFYVRQCHVHY